MSECVHIAFGDSAAGCIRKAIELGMPGDHIVVSRDDFTQGPISDCLKDGGLAQRSQYWSNLKTLHAQLKNVYENYASTLKCFDVLEINTRVVIWLGDSSHDLLASAWLLSYFDKQQLNWQYVELKEIKDLEEFQCVNVALMTPLQIVNSYSGVKPISKHYQQELKSVWNKVASENSHYRIQEKGQIVSVPQNYFDKYILSNISKKEQVLGMLIKKLMANSNYSLTDITIESRLAALQSQNKIKIEMNLARLFLSKIKLI